VEYALFGEGGGTRLAAEIGVPLIGCVPLHPDVTAGGDAGEPAALSGSGPVYDAFEQIAERIVTEIAPLVEMSGCTARLLESVEQALGSSG
jgi:ATP-binding protein involved in chromosome partitioning